jgi:hypothetical protein
MLLVGGNQLPWLFVSGTAFVLTAYIINYFELVQNEFNIIMISLTLGVIGVFLYYYLKRIPVIIAAFLAGGYISYAMPMMFGWNISGFSPLAFVIVGAITSAITIFWYSFALIFITTLSGSLLVLQYFNFGNIPSQAMFIVLVLVGLVTQFVMMQYGPSEA